jgi:hypothetical protein
VVRLGRAVARVSAREVVGRVNSACGRLELGARRGRAQGRRWAARAAPGGRGVSVWEISSGPFKVMRGQGNGRGQHGQGRTTAVR